MGLKFANNASDTLAVAITNSATAMGVSATTSLPSISTTDYVYFTLDDGTNIEVVRAVSGGVANGYMIYSIDRDVDGTGSFAFPVDTKVEIRLPKVALEDLQTPKKLGAVNGNTLYEVATASTDGTAHELDVDGIVKSDRINVNTGGLYVDSGADPLVKMKGYGRYVHHGFGLNDGAQSTLAVGALGKVVEDEKIATFKISGQGFYNLYNSPKTLVASPGAGRAIVLSRALFYIHYNPKANGSAHTDVEKGVRYNAWDTNSPIYTIGQYVIQDTSAAGFTRAQSNFLSSSSGVPKGTVSGFDSFLWVGEPDEDFSVLPNRDLILRASSANNIADTWRVPVATVEHFIQIRYRIVNLAPDFYNLSNSELTGVFNS